MVEKLRETDLIKRLREIIQAGEHDAGEAGGAGRAGALLERLLDIESNNDPVPDAINWEIKTSSRQSLLTLFHLSPRRDPHENTLLSAVRNFGWEPTGNSEYPPGTKSFRCTISTHKKVRGLCVIATDDGLHLSFNSEDVEPQHQSWLGDVRANCGAILENPPRWTWDDIERSAGGKLRNIALVHTRVRKKRYVSFLGGDLYRNFKPSQFRRSLREGIMMVDIDARTQGKGLRDHGTKFRIKLADLGALYEEVTPIMT